MDAQIEKLQTEMEKNNEELTTLIRNQNSNLTQSLNDFKNYIAIEIGKLKTSNEALDLRVKVTEDSVKINSASLASLEESNKALQDKVELLEKNLADQTDCGMRSTLSFRGVYEDGRENYQKHQRY